MKRILLSVVAVICLTATGFAAGNQPTTAKWEGNINIAKLSRYLELSSNQVDEVANISEFFTKQMDRASRSKNDQEKLLQNAVYGNLKLMKKTLTPEQYTKYLKIMNVTLNNRGIQLSK